MQPPVPDIMMPSHQLATTADRGCISPVLSQAGIQASPVSRSRSPLPITDVPITWLPITGGPPTPDGLPITGLPITGLPIDETALPISMPPVLRSRMLQPPMPQDLPEAEYNVLYLWWGDLDDVWKNNCPVLALFNYCHARNIRGTRALRYAIQAANRLELEVTPSDPVCLLAKLWAALQIEYSLTGIRHGTYRMLGRELYIRDYFYADVGSPQAAAALVLLEEASDEEVQADDGEDSDVEDLDRQADDRTQAEEVETMTEDSG